MTSSLLHGFGSSLLLGFPAGWRPSTSCGSGEGEQGKPHSGTTLASIPGEILAWPLQPLRWLVQSSIAVCRSAHPKFQATHFSLSCFTRIPTCSSQRY